MQLTEKDSERMRMLVTPNALFMPAPQIWPVRFSTWDEPEATTWSEPSTDG